MGCATRVLKYNMTVVNSRRRVNDRLRKSMVVDGMSFETNIVDKLW